MIATLQESLRDLIAKGKTQQALDALADNLKGTDEGDTITLLQSRWNRNKNANNMGVLSGGEYQMENNRINYALLSVIGELDESTGKEDIVKQVVQIINNIHIGDVVMGVKNVSNTNNMNSGNTTNTNSGNTNSGNTNTNSGNTNSGNTNTNSSNTTTIITTHYFSLRSKGVREGFLWREVVFF